MILGVDMTDSITKYCNSTIACSHPYKVAESRNRLSILGPIIIHQGHKTGVYAKFVAALISKIPELRDENVMDLIVRWNL